MTIPSLFPNGLRVYLRTLAPDGSPHCMDFPQGRATWSANDQPFVVILGEDENLPVAMFMKEALMGILPLALPETAK